MGARRFLLQSQTMPRIGQSGPGLLPELPTTSWLRSVDMGDGRVWEVRTATPFVIRATFSGAQTPLAWAAAPHQNRVFWRDFRRGTWDGNTLVYKVPGIGFVFLGAVNDPEEGEGSAAMDIHGPWEPRPTPVVPTLMTNPVVVTRAPDWTDNDSSLEHEHYG